jgi:hypothetical protein
MPNRSRSTDVGRSAARAMRAALREARVGIPWSLSRLATTEALTLPCADRPGNRGRLFGRLDQCDRARVARCGRELGEEAPERRWDHHDG